MRRTLIIWMTASIALQVTTAKGATYPPEGNSIQTVSSTQGEAPSQLPPHPADPVEILPLAPPQITAPAPAVLNFDGRLAPLTIALLAAALLAAGYRRWRK
jgi:hypothetical protein